MDIIATFILIMLVVIIGAIVIGYAFSKATPEDMYDETKLDEEPIEEYEE